MVLVHSDAEPCTTAALPHEPESVRTARRQMVMELERHGPVLQIVDTVCDRWPADLLAGTRVTAELRI